MQGGVFIFNRKDWFCEVLMTFKVRDECCIFFLGCTVYLLRYMVYNWQIPSKSKVINKYIWITNPQAIYQQDSDVLDHFSNPTVFYRHQMSRQLKGKKGFVQGCDQFEMCLFLQRLSFQFSFYILIIILLCINVNYYIVCGKSFL